ncbi:hypothetical protein [Ruminococcus sp.]
MKFMKKIMAAVAASAVAVLSFASLTASADLKAQDKAPYNAFLAIQAGGDSKWVSSTDDPAVVAEKNSITEATEATITGDGSYSVDVTMVNGSETIEAMILSTNINAYSFAPEGASTPTGGLPEGCTAKVEIDSIEVQHVGGGSTPLAYAGPSEGALRTADDGTSIRVNIMNVWTKPKVNDIGTGDHVSPDGGLAAGDKVVVNFTVSGISNGGNGEGTTAPSDNSGNDTTTTAANGDSGTDGTTTATNADGTPATTTAAGNNGGSSNGNNSSNGGSSNSSNNSSSGGSSGSNSSKSGTNNAKTSQTGDFGIAAVALGAVATVALGVGAYTITRKKK